MDFGGVARPCDASGNGMRVLGIDTSLRSTGVGIVDTAGSKLTFIECGAIRLPAARSHSECLARIDADLRELIARTKPQAAAIEGIFFCKNVRTAVTLGQARGVAIAACAAAGVPVYEYEPRRMKQALVGYGAAQKEQVGKMVMRLLGLAEMPQEDASDALGLAICHIHSRTSITALEAKPL